MVTIIKQKPLFLEYKRGVATVIKQKTWFVASKIRVVTIIKQGGKLTFFEIYPKKINFAHNFFGVFFKGWGPSENGNVIFCSPP